MDVSHWISFTLSMDTHSSSATIWVCTVYMPCPKSHFPVYAVTVPSDATAIHESSLFGSICDGCVSNGPCAMAKGSRKATPLKETISAPEVFTKSRRVIAFFMGGFSGSALSRTSCAYGQSSGTKYSTSPREFPRRMPWELHPADFLR